MMEAKWTKKTIEEVVDGHIAGNGIEADTRVKVGQESMGLRAGENDEKRRRKFWEVGKGLCL